MRPGSGTPPAARGAAGAAGPSGQPWAFVPDYSRRRRAPRPGGGAAESALLLGPGAGAAAERVHRAWDEGGARLPVAKVRALAAEIGIEDAEAARRTDALLRLLPGLESKVMTMQVKALGALVRDLRAVAQRAVRLRQLLPRADISRLVARNAWLLLDEWAAVEARLEEAVFMLNTYQRSAEEMRCPDGVADPYRNAFAQVSGYLGPNLAGAGGCAVLVIDSVAELEPLITANPEVLDTATLREHLQEMERLYPGSDPIVLLSQNAGFLARISKTFELSPGGRDGLYW